MQCKWLSTVQGIAFLGFICQSNWPISGLITVLWGSGVVAVPLCLVGDFDSQVQHLLMKEMLTQRKIANLSTVFRDLQQTLQIKWPGAEVYPLGSFVTGLAAKSSDADCMVKVPHHDISSERYLVKETAQLLKQYPELYDHVTPKVGASRRIALLKFTYVPTQRNCDVNFVSNIALENSQMMSYYFGLDAKFLSLAAILKFWSKVRRLRSSDTLASNSLNLLIIFYLQQENVAPPFTLLQKHLVRCPVNDWETSFNRILYNSTKTKSLYRLLGGFFKYYSEFNFDEFVVSPLLGRPIGKRQFEDLDSLPEELSLYKIYMNKPNSRPLTINTKLCVQDAIEQRRNTANVTKNKALHFLAHVKFAAKMFDVVPRNNFLNVLLAKYDREIAGKISTFSDIKRLKACVNATVFRK